MLYCIVLFYRYTPLHNPFLISSSASFICTASKNKPYPAYMVLSGGAEELTGDLWQ